MGHSHERGDGNQAMRALKLLLSSLCIASIFCMGRAWGAEPLRIRVSYIAPITNWASILLEKKELARHLGTSYVLEPVRYVGTPQMITALANGELQDGVEGYYSQEYMVLADSPIKSVADLRGKVVATVAAGAAVDVALRTMLRKYGLEDKRDYTMVEAPLATMRAMLADRKVDLVPIVLPFAMDPELRRIARTLFYNKDVVGVTQLLVWTARQSFLDRNRATMIDFMEDTLRITGWFLDPANHQEVVAIASRVTRQPAERFDWPFTSKDYYRAPQMRPNLDALQKNVVMITALGFVKTTIEVRKYSDLSIIEEAAKRLK